MVGVGLDLKRRRAFEGQIVDVNGNEKEFALRRGWNGERVSE